MTYLDIGWTCRGVAHSKCTNNYEHGLWHDWALDIRQDQFTRPFPPLVLQATNVGWEGLGVTTPFRLHGPSQNFKTGRIPRVLKIKCMNSTEALSCTCSNWLAGNWSTQTYKAKSACTEWFLTLIDTKTSFYVSTQAWQSKRLRTLGWEEMMGSVLLGLSGVRRSGCNYPLQTSWTK